MRARLLMCDFCLVFVLVSISQKFFPLTSTNTVRCVCLSACVCVYPSCPAAWFVRWSCFFFFFFFYLVHTRFLFFPFVCLSVVPYLSRAHTHPQSIDQCFLHSPTLFQTLVRSLSRRLSLKFAILCRCQFVIG